MKSWLQGFLKQVIIAEISKEWTYSCFLLLRKSRVRMIVATYQLVQHCGMFCILLQAYWKDFCVNIPRPDESS